ncbi:hypothetical protein DIC66_21655 [Rhodoferax lacus]|uniref:Uncharacterized protein n=1 Tax=Rhodoferax lacus TaxID=2184758 RepID=A0A3E1R6L3_9BURK|nr:hypothetical protein DIC66_21655 [Rhodoferax lacus]
MEVILGVHTVKAFVSAPREYDVMGIVRMGLEYGLLARTGPSSYVRVNGSQVEKMDTREVEAAITRSQMTGRGESYAMSRLHSVHINKPRCVPTVIIRKHRKIQRSEIGKLDSQSMTARDN